MKHSVVFHIEELHLNINERGKKNGKGQQYELRTGGKGQEERKQIESETESMIACAMRPRTFTYSYHK